VQTGGESRGAARRATADYADLPDPTHQGVLRTVSLTEIGRCPRVCIAPSTKFDPRRTHRLEQGFAFAILGYVGSRAAAPRNERRRRGGNAGFTSPRIC
jgi:hypothetical protein